VLSVQSVVNWIEGLPAQRRRLRPRILDSPARFISRVSTADFADDADKGSARLAGWRAASEFTPAVVVRKIYSRVMIVFAGRIAR
jgi:hypothetical protein